MHLQSGFALSALLLLPMVLVTAAASTCTVSSCEGNNLLDRDDQATLHLSCNQSHFTAVVEDWPTEGQLSAHRIKGLYIECSYGKDNMSCAAEWDKPFTGLSTHYSFYQEYKLAPGDYNCSLMGCVQIQFTPFRLKKSTSTCHIPGPAATEEETTTTTVLETTSTQLATEEETTTTTVLETTSTQLAATEEETTTTTVLELETTSTQLIAVDTTDTNTDITDADSANSTEDQKVPVEVTTLQSGPDTSHGSKYLVKAVLPLSFVVLALLVFTCAVSFTAKHYAKRRSLKQYHVDVKEYFEGDNDATLSIDITMPIPPSLSAESLCYHLYKPGYRGVAGDSPSLLSHPSTTTLKASYDFGNHFASRPSLINASHATASLNESGCVHLDESTRERSVTSPYLECYDTVPQKHVVMTEFVLPEETAADYSMCAAEYSMPRTCDGMSCTCDSVPCTCHCESTFTCGDLSRSGYESFTNDDHLTRSLGAAGGSADITWGLPIARREQTEPENDDNDHERQTDDESTHEKQQRTNSMSGTCSTSLGSSASSLESYLGGGEEEGCVADRQLRTEFEFVKRRREMEALVTNLDGHFEGRDFALHDVDSSSYVQV